MGWLIVVDVVPAVFYFTSVRFHKACAICCCTRIFCWVGWLDIMPINGITASLKSRQKERTQRENAPLIKPKSIRKVSNDNCTATAKLISQYSKKKVTRTKIKKITISNNFVVLNGRQFLLYNYIYAPKN